MMTKAIILIAAFAFAVAFGILNARVAQSDNDRASGPTIRTLALQYYATGQSAAFTSTAHANRAVRSVDLVVPLFL